MQTIKSSNQIQELLLKQQHAINMQYVHIKHKHILYTLYLVWFDFMSFIVVHCMWLWFLYDIMFYFELMLLYCVAFIVFLMCYFVLVWFASQPIWLSEALQQWSQRTEYSLMQTTYTLKNCSASLAGIVRATQFLERRSEAAYLHASDLARHLSTAQTGEERRCLWAKAFQNSTRSGLCCPCFCLACLWELSIQLRKRSQQNEAEAEPGQELAPGCGAAPAQEEEPDLADGGAYTAVRERDCLAACWQSSWLAGNCNWFDWLGCILLYLIVFACIWLYCIWFDGLLFYFNLFCFILFVVVYCL